MHTLTTRRGTITCMIILLLTAGAVAGIDHYGRNSRVYGRVGTIRAQQIVKMLVDDPADAYRIWREAGYQGRTVVFVSDRWESFDPGELIPAQMFRAYPLQLYNTAKLIEDEHLNGVTFLYVASLKKIIRKIVAVVSESEVGRMKEMSRKVKDSRVTDKGVFLSRQGYPRWFTTAANFDGAGEPVLLYVGASYFRSSEPEDLYRQLSKSGLQSDCVILCNEVGKDSVTPNETTKLNRFAKLIGVTQALSGSESVTTPKTQLQRPTVPAL